MGRWETGVLVSSVEVDRQFGDTAHDDSREALGFADVKVGAARQHGFHNDAAFKSREGGPKAMMQPFAEGKIPFRLSLYVESVGVLPPSLVAVGRGPEQD